MATGRSPERFPTQNWCRSHSGNDRWAEWLGEGETWLSSARAGSKEC